MKDSRINAVHGIQDSLLSLQGAKLPIRRLSDSTFHDECNAVIGGREVWGPSTDFRLDLYMVAKRVEDFVRDYF